MSDDQEVQQPEVEDVEQENAEGEAALSGDM